ncbi:hypothetical protein U9M48_038039 [Paspalum notatum var. saurae]|uniref:Uncharacterized protein n=1 Tax=Paspalum notatum var. saurae TaxID=547442 RepID=A0AAQ3UIG7_PASNO
MFITPNVRRLFNFQIPFGTTTPYGSSLLDANRPHSHGIPGCFACMRKTDNKERKNGVHVDTKEGGQDIGVLPLQALIWCHSSMLDMSQSTIRFGARALDEAIAHVPLADILDLGSEFLHLLGHTVPIRQGLKETPPRWLHPQTNSEVLEGVLDVVGDIADLLNPSLDHLVLITLFVCGHQESQHHLELVLDEGVVTLYAELQGDLLRERGSGVAKRSVQHGLAHAQRRRLHGSPPIFSGVRSVPVRCYGSQDIVLNHIEIHEQYDKRNKETLSS